MIGRTRMCIDASDGLESVQRHRGGIEMLQALKVA